jgi:two-component system CheB/CheR fusion protein
MKDFNKDVKLKKSLKDDGRLVVGSDFFKSSWRESWIYIKTVVDAELEPVLILDKDFRVLAANNPFYRLFQVEPKDTEGKIVYELGNGQWNIPSLRKLLEDILPKNTFFKGFEVAREFPKIGRKVMILNARRIHQEKKYASKSLPPIIILALEDVTDVMAVAEMLAHHANQTGRPLEK